MTLLSLRRRPHKWVLDSNQDDTGEVGVRIYCAVHHHKLIVLKDTLDKYISAAELHRGEAMNLADRIQEVLDMNKKVMLEYNGRPDCKNCSLAETIEPILHDARKDVKPPSGLGKYTTSELEAEIKYRREHEHTAD